MAAKVGLMNWVGRLAGYALLTVLVLQSAVIVARSLFSVSLPWLDESVIYAHATTIALAIAWTLSADRHVRIDILRVRLSVTAQRVVERIGLAAIVAASFGLILLSINFVSSSWAVQEGSSQFGGLPGVFLVKSLVPVLFALLALAAFQRLRRI
ncbi:MAG: TRAP transporter small permease subunit [Ahrensia sp.]|nr:TRAP transporter small permease subunit [Ahrensia sp.]